MLRIMSMLVALNWLAPLGGRAEAQDWVYFDLGDVVISGTANSGYNFVPGAPALIADLHQRGYKVALLTNIPESWGTSCGEKVETLKSFLGEHWHDTQAFDWKAFDLVIVPPSDRYRKPHKFMFLNALAAACPARAAFVGDDVGEVGVAKDLGLAVFHKQPAPAPLPTADELVGLVAGEFHFPQPAACDFTTLYSSVLDSADQGKILGCGLTP